MFVLCHYHFCALSRVSFEDTFITLWLKYAEWNGDFASIDKWILSNFEVWRFWFFSLCKPFVIARVPFPPQDCPMTHLHLFLLSHLHLFLLSHLHLFLLSHLHLFLLTYHLTLNSFHRVLQGPNPSKKKNQLERVPMSTNASFHFSCIDPMPL